MAKILIINGPNLNLLGTREPSHYGSETLDTLMQRAAAVATAAGHELDTFQHNAEHALVERVQQAGKEGISFIVINPAAFTHTSVALRDALAAVDIPFIEVHLSNIHRREDFRRQSFFSDIAVGTITGLGGAGYELAVQAACHQLATNA
ncbi:MAG TPA: type II 3-dehydroquinate dehydratase [Gammaproteobacteria bacterium]|nr:type II 3-dehydroquinate dehydratase [Gammaproteobacteria bacterium]